MGVQCKIKNESGAMENINPKTNTSSVNDDTTGASLNETIDRMWNAINNKLSRVVNSVNGRTGVVVLNASDVGLGDVDNVSFANIKKWVIQAITDEFGDKCFKLFDSLYDVDDLINENDPSSENCSFFANHGYNEDYRSYVGYIYRDTGTNELQSIYKPINTVGYADNSLVYDEKINANDKRGGGLGVNIYKFEDALKLYNDASGAKAESGLYIDKSKITGDLYFFDGVYGNGDASDTSALLYFDTATTPETAKNVSIFIDEYQVVFGFKIRQTSFKVGDMIFCNFKDYRDNTSKLVPSGMSGDMMVRSPGIGKVVSIPDVTGAGNYRIDFYSLNPNIGWGLQYTNTHRTGRASKQLDINLTKGNVQYVSGETNTSGLQVLKPDNDSNPLNFDNPLTTASNNKWTVFPYGPVGNVSSGNGGLFISPDLSLNVMPYAAFGEGSYNGDTYVDKYGRTRPYGSHLIDNWAIKGPSVYDNTDIDTGSLSDQCMLGINLYKAMDFYYDAAGLSFHGAQYRFCNMSGLKIMNSRPLTAVPTADEKEKLSPRDFGFNDNEWVSGVNLATVWASGGLMINVGQFLEVSPGTYQEKADDYYNCGKVNVRIGKGLKAEPTVYDANNNRIAGNRIQLKIDNPNGGLAFDDAGNLIATGGSTGGGSSSSVTLKNLSFVDNYGTKITYTPSASCESSGETVISLGAGLKITL